MKLSIDFLSNHLYLNRSFSHSCISLRFFQQVDLILINLLGVYVRDRECLEFIVDAVLLLESLLAHFVDLFVLSEPRMLKGFFEAGTLRSVLLQQFLAEVNGLFRHGIPWLEREVGGILNSLSCDFFVFLIIEG